MSTSGLRPVSQHEKREDSGVQANIRSVTVQGDEQDRDADLDRVQQFDVETDSGHRYVVVRQGPPVASPSDWEVTSSEDGHLVGHVHLLGAGIPGATTYRFKKAGAFFSGGKQMDLWNAVQSLLQ
jgi:hypothetical protein